MGTERLIDAHSFSHFLLLAFWNPPHYTHEEDESSTILVELPTEWMSGSIATLVLRIYCQHGDDGPRVCDREPNVRANQM